MTDITDRLWAACIHASDTRMTLMAAMDEIRTLRDEAERLRLTIGNWEIRAQNAVDAREKGAP
jgi:hypothetical protein